MLRYSLYTSRRMIDNRINLRYLGITDPLTMQQKCKSSEVEFKGKEGRKTSHQKNSRTNIKNHDGKYIDDFANRWSRITSTKDKRNKCNPNDQKMQTVNNLKPESYNIFGNQTQIRTVPRMNSTNENRTKTWKGRLSKQQETNQKRKQSDPLSSFLRKRNEQNDTWIRSGQGGSNEQKKLKAPITDMKDVSALRAAFLKSIKRVNNTIKKKPEEKQEWRRSGGAKEYRERLKQKQRQKEQYEDQVESKFVKVESLCTFGAKDETEKVAPKKKQKEKEQQQQQDDLQVILPSSSITVSAISSLLRVKIKNILRMLRETGFRPESLKTGKCIFDENTIVDLDTVELLALDLGLEVMRSTDDKVHQSASEEARHLLLQHRRGMNEDEEINPKDKNREHLQSRPPVVCIMGHVDHGKTTLMDSLRRKSQNIESYGKQRKTKKKNAGKKEKGIDMAGSEAGGITQAISAFQILLEQDSSKAVTFLDTPGHAAFRAMRESGSYAADVICLVIAADDGVSPQTVEILDFYKSIVSEAGMTLSLVVAMTKVDKPGIVVDESQYKIETQLMEQGIIAESFAGTTTYDTAYGSPVQVIPVSGLTGEGLENLIESLTLQSEIMELRANSDDSAEGIIMDARVEKGIGVVVDCIVRWGSLKRGDIVLSGVHSGKVKALKDVNNATLKKATPSQPVKIIGFKSLPKAGAPIICVSSEKEAEEMVERRLASVSDNSFRTQIHKPTKLEVTGIAAQQHSMLEHIHSKYEIQMDAEDDTISIPVVIKADADGTLSALREALVAIGTEAKGLENKTMIVDIISEDIGPINENDIQIALESNAPIFCFNVKTTGDLPQNSENVILKSHNVIYSLLDSAKEVFAEFYLPKIRVEELHGRATIQVVFEINGTANKIAGLRVNRGILFKDKCEKDNAKCWYRVLRKDRVISPCGDIISASSLKCAKDHVQSVRQGEECGLELDGYIDFKEGDIVECYSMEERKIILD
mmetsp:Transcript_5142/g.5979  ORF Transcript_5142/g.5979 Transcript_5142/m.5979 type:complete len:986 (-) Transcript_5142:164-3121(-)